MFTYILCILLILQELPYILAANRPNSTLDTSNQGHDNINVILFLAHTDYGVNYEKNDGIAYMNISSVGKIKPCTTRPESNLPRSFVNIIQRSQPKECDCKKLLESSIFSLMGWARNAMGMTTAVESLINNEKVEESQKRSNYYDYKLETIDSSALKRHHLQQKQQQSSAYMNMHNKEGVHQLHLRKVNNIKHGDDDDDLPILKRDINVMKDGVPVINSFPHQPKLKFNNIHKHNKFEDFVNVHRVKRKLIVEPKNTQVFEIDSTNEEPKEILDIPSLEKSGRPRSIWDILGVMSAIRSSFFVNFFNPLLDPYQRMLDEENGLNINSLGQIRIPSLFQLVQTTLTNLQKETKTNNANGYLLIIFGGRLSDISETKSDLVQSVKHVLETTDIENTLVIVTGSCPKNHTHNGTTHRGMKTDEEFLLPVYAKGPNVEILSKAKELFDIPVQIKEIIESAKSEETNNSDQKRINLETVNENSKLIDGKHISDIENMFSKEWKQNIKSDDNGNDQEADHQKWVNMRKRRSIVKNVHMRGENNGVKLIVNTFSFIVLFLFVFFL